MLASSLVVRANCSIVYGRPQSGWRASDFCCRASNWPAMVENLLSPNTRMIKAMDCVSRAIGLRSNITLATSRGRLVDRAPTGHSGPLARFCADARLRCACVISIIWPVFGRPTKNSRSRLTSSVQTPGLNERQGDNRG